MRASGGVDVVFAAPRWSERWVLEDGVTMPESREHELASTLLKEVLRAWIERTGRDASAGGNLAVRWDLEHPRIGVDPDVYLVEPALPPGRLKSLRTWVEGHHPPRVAVEVVSEDGGEKDYVDAPRRYAASGTRELWVFDPERYGSVHVGGPWALQVWRRMRAGEFRQVYAGEGPAYSDELGAWLVITDAGTRLRLADDEAGERLWLTADEASAARAEAERARADEAEAELARLRAAMAAMKGR